MNYCALFIVDVMVIEIFSKSENENIPVTTNVKEPFNKLLQSLLILIFVLIQ